MSRGTTPLPEKLANVQELLAKDSEAEEENEPALFEDLPGSDRLLEPGRRILDSDDEQDFGPGMFQLA